MKYIFALFLSLFFFYNAQAGDLPKSIITLHDTDVFIGNMSEIKNDKNETAASLYQTEAERITAQTQIVTPPPPITDSTDKNAVERLFSIPLVRYLFLFVMSTALGFLFSRGVARKKGLM